HEQLLDQTIQPKLKHSSIQPLLKTHPIILTIPTFQFLHSHTPPKLIINQPLHLTKQFTHQPHYKFINPVLTNIK
ncbi:transcription antitermination factor NusB, partial [Staphylococcus hominis]|uniref:transcription antitermination factor NusB n=1 Tax=Staphylococcus hominis TaxID=1290 RepID=UPI0028D0D505